MVAPDLDIYIIDYCVLYYVKCLSYKNESRRSIRCPVTFLDIYSRETYQNIYDTSKDSGLHFKSPGTVTCYVFAYSFKLVQLITLTASYGQTIALQDFISKLSWNCIHCVNVYCELYL